MTFERYTLCIPGFENWLGKIRYICQYNIELIKKVNPKLYNTKVITTKKAYKTTKYLKATVVLMIKKLLVFEYKQMKYEIYTTKQSAKRKQCKNPIDLE